MRPKVFAITCRQIPWRRAPLLQRLAAAGIDAEIFEGIHGPTLGLAPQFPAFDSPTYKISTGYVGLFLSNLCLWHRMMERPEEAFLVLEDDALPCPHFWREFDRSFAALPTDWEMAWVGSCCTEGKNNIRWNDRVSEVRYPLCTHAMLYRRSAIPKVLDRMTVCNSHIDIQLQQLVASHLRTYTFTPPLFSQAAPPGEGLHTMRGQTWQDLPGWFDYQKLYRDQVDRVKGPSIFVEVGTWLGKSASFMAQQIKVSYKLIQFFAVDTFTGSPTNPANPAYKPTLDQIGGDYFFEWQKNLSRTGVIDYAIPLRSESAAAAQRFQDHSVDFCFIDADHAYRSVKADIAAWCPKMKPGGVLAGHDIDQDDVRRAVADSGLRYRVWERCWISER